MVVQTSIWDRRSVFPLTMPEILSGRNIPRNGEIQVSMMKAFDYIKEHKKIMCSISGGYDSDILIDLILRCGGRGKSVFVFNDTGMEYTATKEHIQYLTRKYAVEIVELTPKKTIPT